MAQGLNNIVSYAMVLVLLNIVLGISLFSMNTSASEWILTDITGSETRNIFSYFSTESSGTPVEGFQTVKKSGFTLNSTLKQLNREEEFIVSQTETDVSLESNKEETGTFTLLETILAIPETLALLAGIVGIAMLSPIFLLVVVGATTGTIATVFLALLLLPLQVQGFVLFTRLILGRSRI